MQRLHAFQFFLLFHYWFDLIRLKINATILLVGRGLGNSIKLIFHKQSGQRMHTDNALVCINTYSFKTANQKAELASILGKDQIIKMQFEHELRYYYQRAWRRN